jgi:hypothetical protein
LSEKFDKHVPVPRAVELAEINPLPGPKLQISGFDDDVDG